MNQESLSSPIDSRLPSPEMRDRSVRILILEDDPATGAFLQTEFTSAGFESTLSSDGNEALTLALAQEYDLLVIDVMVPGRTGLEVVREIRRLNLQTPVIFLSAKHSLEERIEGLRSGADDYLTKPFSFSELLARAQAILRRSNRGQEANSIFFCEFELDLISRVVKGDNISIELQQKEFALLELFMRHQDLVLTKTQILEKVWSYSFDPQTNVVDVLVCRLRRKVEKIGLDQYIKTIRGIGYALKKP